MKFKAIFKLASKMRVSKTEVSKQNASQHGAEYNASRRENAHAKTHEPPASPHCTSAYTTSSRSGGPGWSMMGLLLCTVIPGADVTWATTPGERATASQWFDPYGCISSTTSNYRSSNRNCLFFSSYPFFKMRVKKSWLQKGQVTEGVLVLIYNIIISPQS